MMDYLKKLPKPIIVALASGAAMATAHAADPVTTLTGACWAKTSDVTISSVDWPAGTGWTMPLSNVPFETGYSNSVSVGSDTAFSGGYPGRWSSSSEVFSGAMAALNGKTLTYMDQRHINNTPATVTYTFATPLTQHEAMLVLDVDLSEKTRITFYDESNAPINFDKVTAVQVSGSAGTLAIADATPTEFALTGSGANDSNPVWAFSPVGTQKINKVVVVQETNNEGSWDIAFVHATCALPPAPVVVAPVPTLDAWGLSLLSLLGAGAGGLGLRRRKRAK